MHMSGCAKPCCARLKRRSPREELRVFKVKGEGLTNHAEKGAGSVAQFLGLLRVAACTGVGALHQLVRDIVGRCCGIAWRHKTGDL